MIYLITTVLISLFISAFCSLFEACLLSMSNNDIAKMSLKKPKKAKIWKNFKSNIQKPIAVILIINTLAHTIGASLSGAQFDKLFGEKWIVIFSFVFSFAMIQWTEILPKTLGVKYNLKIANIVTFPLYFLIKIFNPVVKVIEFFNLPFVGRKKAQDKMDIIDEISVLSKFAFSNSIISKDQENIITRTVNLSTVKAKDIMIPINEIKLLTDNMSIMEALLEAHIHNHTRFPLVKNENANEVIGYINFKDIVSALQINPTNPSLIGIVRPIISVYENDTYPNIFKKITSQHQHIAIVKNEKNNFIGLLTLEDLIEEIVGEIEDEYDVLQTHLFPIANQRFLVGGGVKVGKINMECELNLPDEELTINEWIIKNFGSDNRSGNKYKEFGASFILKKIRRGKISEVIIDKS